MRVACVGGGPGGLFFAALAQAALPTLDVTVFERHHPSATFGFGLVFSDATLSNLESIEPDLLAQLREQGIRWDGIEVRLHGHALRCGGNGMTGIARPALLSLLHRLARRSGVRLLVGAQIRDLTELEGFDLVVAADGANSALRRRLAAELAPSVAVASAKFIWFGTSYPFDGLTFIHTRGPHGVFAVHGYPYRDGEGTFIVETDEASWRAAGLDTFDPAAPPDVSDLASKNYLEQLFAEAIDGHPLLVNKSRWASFRTVRTACWHAGRVVLLGDAAHTAHFSVGSGTKMAMEDAVALTQALRSHPDDLAAALHAYEAAARPSVEKIQGSARPSLSWWEHVGRYYETLGSEQFTFHFLTRATTRRKIARPDPSFVAKIDSWWLSRHGTAPLDTPLTVRGHRYPYRLVTRGSPVPQVRWLRAPADEAGLPASVEQLDSALRAGAGLIGVHGGTPLTRVLLSECSRLVRKTPTLIAEGGMDRDRAETLVLSGRADLVMDVAAEG